ncbi:hypothetical protein [Streptococcus sobrinus]|uniref:hypothetical protein n=1 Tax=Streptococcus sobrinus TaxID=1310 RepID=UPI000D705D16|nr:hypothetical protein [Streptococcus sobrinus]AWN62120.1 hypothetical protein DLJ52_07960 [Streptococcus sobrinus]AWN63994.1 hypothetical protein DLJ51_07965 [Streptococcus sobrinus]SQG20940.1 Uncharacterised protein [Streptococcus sobrinus]
MKKSLQALFLVSLIATLVIIYLILIGFISVKELINGAFIGAVVSLIVSVPFEYLNYKNGQKDKLNVYFWNGVVPYQNSLQEIFASSRDFHFFESIIFEKYNIPKDSEDWRDYVEAYNKFESMLSSRIEKFCGNIVHATDVHSNEVSFLSELLQNIERMNCFGRTNQVYEKCYGAYRIIENIDWTLTEARQLIDDTTFSDYDLIRKNCSRLIVLRWLSDLYFNNYDRGIEDIDDDENISETDKENVGKAEDDLNNSVYEVMRMMRKL